MFTEFKASAVKYADSTTFGVREVFSINDEMQPNGKVFKKLSMGKYNWTDYRTIEKRVENLSDGLLSFGKIYTNIIFNKNTVKPI